MTYHSQHHNHFNPTPISKSFYILQASHHFDFTRVGFHLENPLSLSLQITLQDFRGGKGSFSAFAEKFVRSFLKRKFITRPRKPINNENYHLIRNHFVRMIRSRASFHHTATGGSQIFCWLNINEDNCSPTTRPTPTKIFNKHLRQFIDARAFSYHTAKGGLNVHNQFTINGYYHWSVNEPTPTKIFDDDFAYFKFNIFKNANQIITNSL